MLSVSLSLLELRGGLLMLSVTSNWLMLPVSLSPQIGLCCLSVCHNEVLHSVRHLVM